MRTWWKNYSFWYQYVHAQASQIAVINLINSCRDYQCPSINKKILSTSAHDGGWHENKNNGPILRYEGCIACTSVWLPKKLPKKIISRLILRYFCETLIQILYFGHKKRWNCKMARKRRVFSERWYYLLVNINVAIFWRQAGVKRLTSVNESMNSSLATIEKMIFYNFSKLQKRDTLLFLITCDTLSL